MTTIAITGFGRVGRLLFRQCMAHPNLTVNALNDLNLAASDMAYLAKYDSTYGVWNTPALSHHGGNTLCVGDRTITCSQQSSCAFIRNHQQHADIIIDASGSHHTTEISPHELRNSDTRLILTHYHHETIPHIVNVTCGVDDLNILTNQHIIAASSCDAVAVLPVYQHIVQKYEVISANITTLHPYTGEQNLLDGKSYSHDVQAGRSALNNLIPKTTSLRDILLDYFPDHARKLSVMSFRTPTEIISAVQLIFFLDETPDEDELITNFDDWIASSSIGCISDAPCVSRDFIGSDASFIFDRRWLELTNNQLRLILWYDNEWGYTSRIMDLVEHYNQAIL